MLKGKIKEESDLTVWAEYKDGFQLQVRFTPRARLRKISEACQRTEWDSKTHQRKEVLDQPRFYRRMAEEIVTGWRGLTPEVLKKLVDMTDYPESAVPYSVDDCAELMSQAYDLDLWVQQICADLDHFEAARRAAETKNS